MVKSRIDNLCGTLPGVIAGRGAGGPSGRRNGRGASAPRHSAEVRLACVGGARRSLSGWGVLFALLCLTLFLPVSRAAAQVEQIVNSAQIVSNAVPMSGASVIVTKTLGEVPTSIEFLRYAPLLAGAQQVTVSQTSYRTGSDTTAPFALMQPPVPAGSTAAIDLSKPVPLTTTAIFHQCEPIFIRLTDANKNVDATVRDTAIVTVSNPVTGDTEVLRLTETGPDTGVFTGYIQSAGSVCPNNPVAGTYSGFLPVADANKITALFTGNDGSDTASSFAVVDPFGMLFNSITGQPVDGGSITLIDASTGAPATVYGDDGVSSFPATVTTGGTPSDGSGRHYSFPPGQFRFPFVKPGTYRFQVTPPAGYVVPSTASDAALQALPTAPFALGTGSRLETFTVNPGPTLHIDVPVDPLPAVLWLQKTAGKTSAAIGDFVPYQLDLLNNAESATALNVTVTDRLPAGFRYRKGSASSGGKSAADPAISGDGRTLTFTVADLAPKGSVSIRYVAEVAAGAKEGSATNVATAHSFATTSNLAQATVQVQSDFLSSRSILMGRVERGPCGLDWDEGVEGIRIYLEDGSFVNTDKRGMFHFEGVKPGTHVVQLDLDSLPDGFQVYSCTDNTRFAGRSFSQFVDTQGGTLWRADFRVGKPDDESLYRERKAAELRKREEAAKKLTEERLSALERTRKANAPAQPEEEEESPQDDWATPSAKAAAPAAAAVPPAPEAAPVDEWADTPAETEPAPAVKPAAAPSQPAVAGTPDAVSLELRSALEQGGVVYSPVLELPRGPMKARSLEVELPEGLVYRRGSATGDGHTIPDPALAGRTLSFDLSGATEKTGLALRFSADFAAEAPSGEYITRAAIVYGRTGDERKTYADNVLARIRKQERDTLPSLVLRPTFDTFEDQLSDEDKKMLDATAATIKDFTKRGILTVRQLLVIGHTDDVRIARRSRKIYRDNTALSIGRARSVARYLKEQMGLTPAQISASGRGESAPVASNRNAEGRALNRRVEVYILTEKVVERVTTVLKKDASGVQRALLPGTAAAAAVAPTAAPTSAATAAATAGPKAGANAGPRGAAATAPGKSETGARGVPVRDGKSAAAWSDAPISSEDNSGWLPRAASPLLLLVSGASREGAAMSVAQPADGERVCLSPELPALIGSQTPAQEPVQQEQRVNDLGILSPMDGSALPDPISAVRVVLNSTLTPRLLLDGVEVPAERIGFTLKDTKTDNTLYSYIGINFGTPGLHTITLQGRDPFGNVRFERSSRITRVGAIAAIKVVAADGNVADAKTPVRMKLELFDAAGVRVASATELVIHEGNLRALRNESLFPDAPQEKGERVQVDKDGYVLFQPVNASGPYRAVLGSGKTTVEAETYVKPKMRDWILVGLGEGTIGYNAVSGHMENLRSSGTEENLYEDGRIAFYGKGSIQGKWLLTMAYDSAKSRPQTTNSLFQTINPETYYTLYGDASQQQYDAASARKLYLKIEREQFYAVFGDFDTNLTVTELSRYSRRLNGLKSEWQGKNFEANVFGTSTDQAYARDEMQGDGTSGLYHLSRKPVIANSEKITIEIRDRFRSELILSSRVLSRFSDYSIDYDAGTVFFKEPIHSRDDTFNPQFIVVEYETVNAGGNAITAGGRVGTRLLDNKVKAGLTYVHEGQVTGSGNLYGIDTTVKLPGGVVLKGEAATSETKFAGDNRHGNAYLAEAQQQSQNFLGKIYFREQDNGFGLGQQNGSETGTRKAGLDGSYKFGDSLAVAGEAYRQYNLGTGGMQDVIEEKTNYTRGAFTAHLGGRYASDTLGDGSHKVSNQLTVGGSWLTLDKRLTLHADHDQSIGKNNNASFPTRTTFGADYKLTEKVILTGQQEFTSGAGADSNTTRIGFKSTPWSGGALSSSMQRDTNDNGARLFALFGLKQNWKITDKWSVDGGLDRSQTVNKSGNYTFNVNVPQASGSSEDFSAVSLGSSYVEKKWNWNNRLEYRTSPTEEKWGAVSAFVGEPHEGWGWSTRLQVFDTRSTSTGSTINDDLRLGLVYRPLRTRWIILDRLDLIYGKQNGIAGNLESRRVVNNLNANFRPDSRSEISLQYGAKYVLETIDGGRYDGYTDLIGIEGRYDVTRAWDLGARCSLLHSWGPGQLNYSTGLSMGYNVVQNAWLSLGYNLLGFSDKDFSAADYTAQGPYLRFRFKFDQNSVKDAVKSMNL